MIYEFRCQSCGRTHEEWRSVSECAAPGPLCCNQTAARVFSAGIIGDEIKSRWHFSPGRKRWEKGHGGYFNLGLGQWVDSKSDAKRKAKAAGLKEVGNDFGHRIDKDYQKKAHDARTA